MATATFATPTAPAIGDEQQGPKYLYRVYLSMPYQPLPTAIEWTHLAVWGPRMYDRVKLEMLFYAWMLVAVASFDLAAWSLLFNQILNSGSFHLILTPASIILGL